MLTNAHTFIRIVLFFRVVYDRGLLSRLKLTSCLFKRRQALDNVGRFKTKRKKKRMLFIMITRLRELVTLHFDPWDCYLSPLFILSRAYTVELIFYIS